MNNLLVSFIVSFVLMLASGCSEQANKPGSAESPQEQNLSGSETETPTAPKSSTDMDPDHVSGNTSPSSSNISGN